MGLSNFFARFKTSKAQQMPNALPAAVSIKSESKAIVDCLIVLGKSLGMFYSYTMSVTFCFYCSKGVRQGKKQNKTR